jgi:thiamine-phosphate pyrophosphorylase
MSQMLSLHPVTCNLQHYMFSLAVISHPAMLPGEAAIIRHLFEGGLECFHLRKPDADEQAVRELLEAIPAAYHSRIALHAFHQLANEYKINRLHFTEQHRVSLPKKGDASLEMLKEQGRILSTSLHDLATLQQLPAVFSYAFFSPVFDSISKQQYKGVTGDGFYLNDEQKPVKVIALGGIDAGNIQTVADMNFDGAAILGTIWNEPAKAVERWVAFQKAAQLIKVNKASRLPSR